MRAIPCAGLLAHTTLFLSLGLFLRLTSAQASTPQDPDYTCAPDRPCAVGCCGQFGICGMGPEFCSPENCVNSCDAKSECDPAGWGPTYALSETCPLNVCCSKFGFCGTTEEFCGDAIVPNPSCGGATVKRNIGYYEGWSNTRVCDVMEPESIMASGYTHLNFAFASIDPNTFEVVPASATDVALYSRLTGLKRIYPFLQVWISIGGWSMNDPDQPTATTFSDLAGSSSAQAAFTSSLISFMSTYGFDGVDIDWEYPVAPERSGRPEDLANYPTFLTNIRNAFASAGHSWGLTITLPSSFWYLQNFDIVRLEPIVDWFNMMGVCCLTSSTEWMLKGYVTALYAPMSNIILIIEYDLHGTWDSTDVWIGAFVNAHTNLTEIDESLKLLWRNNISPDKVVLGIGFYGRSFALADPSCTAPGCPFSGAAPAGPCTASAGTLSFSEIENTVIAQGGTVTLDETAAVKIVTWDGNWVSYDDATTFKMKADYANSVCLGGTMVWAVSLDDTAATATQALAAALGIPIDGSPRGSNALLANPPSIDSCAFTECRNPSDPGFTACPAGQSAVFSVTDGCGVSNDEIAQAGTDSTFPHRYYCCPSNAMPTCSAASIAGGDHPLVCAQAPCPDGSVQVYTSPSVGSDTGSDLNCVISSRNMCCTPSTPGVTPRSLGCQWVGNAPRCSAPGTAAACPAGTSALVSTEAGEGGPRCTSGLQTLCCPPEADIDPRQCEWERNGSLLGRCLPGCSGGRIAVAQDVGQPGCTFGASSFCCPPPQLRPGSSSSSSTATAFHDVVESWLNGGARCDPMAARSLDLDRRGLGFATSADVAGFLAPNLRNNANNDLFRDIWDDALAAHRGVSSVTYDQAQEAVAIPNYDPTLSLNELLCAQDPAAALFANQHAADLCSPMDESCPPDTLTRMQNTALDNSFAIDWETGGIIDLTTDTAIIDGNIFKNKTKGGFCRFQYGDHIEIVGSASAASLKTRSLGSGFRTEGPLVVGSLESRDSDPFCSINLHCVDMYIKVPPLGTLWSFHTVPNGTGDPITLTDSIISHTFLTNVGNWGVYGPVDAFSHNVEGPGCRFSYSMFNSQLDNHGIVASYNCMGYDGCAFDANAPPRIPDGTGPGVNPGSG
ncbi:hypothetical protein F5884DRAFT_749620 [Xylogone sp. PMI_703]|nr:hypothetical protein F5884DRAFT_749620 [Xylogone sp. PMI_703]